MGTKPQDLDFITDQSLSKVFAWSESVRSVPRCWITAITHFLLTHMQSPQLGEVRSALLRPIDDRTNSLPPRVATLPLSIALSVVSDQPVTFQGSQHTIYLHSQFCEFLCSRRYYDLIAGAVLLQFLNALPSLDPTIPLPPNDIARHLIGPSIVSNNLSRLDDLFLLFRAGSGSVPCDASLRLLFVFELLKCGEVLTFSAYCSWLFRRFGAIVHTLGEDQLSQEWRALSRIPLVVPAATEEALLIRDLGPGWQYDIERLAVCATGGRLSVFAGAGVSKAKPAAAPTWFEIRDACTAALIKTLTESGTLTAAAGDNYRSVIVASTMKTEALMQIIHEVVAGHLFGILSVLSIGTFNDNHWFIAEGIRNRFLKRVLTTNFDTYIEQATAECGVAVDVVAAENEFAGSSRHEQGPTLFKLHGTADREDTIVMTLNAAGQPLTPFKRQRLVEAFDESVMLFVGYSGMDSDIQPALLSMGEGNRELTWCFRPFDRTANAMAIVDAFKSGGDRWDCNVDRLFRELASRLFGVEVRRAGTGGTSVAGIERYFHSWAMSLSTTARLEIVARFLAHVGRVSESESELNRLIELKEENGESTWRVTELLGDLAFGRGNVQQARDHYRNAIEGLGQAPSTSDEDLQAGAIKVKLAKCELSEFEFDAAERVLAEVDGIATAVASGARSELDAELEECRGELWLVRLELRTAFAHYRRALAIRRRIGDILGAARCTERLAGILTSRRRYGTALPLMQLSMTTWRELNDQQQIARGFRNLALIAIKQGRYDEAAGLFKQAMAGYEKLEEHRQWERCGNELTAMLLDQGRNRQAATVYDEMSRYFDWLSEHGGDRELEAYADHMKQVYIDRRWEITDLSPFLKGETP